MKPRETIEAFDKYLEQKGLPLDAVVIGGAALELLGIVSRQTRDCDILHPELPDVILVAAKEFAELRRSAGDLLDDDWLNNGPASLVEDLPPGWEQRVQPAFEGTAITLQCLGRLDLLRSKLFALCDRATDIGDCIALAPTSGELDEILPWLELQDTNELWPDHVREVLADLKQRLVDGV